MKTTFIISLFCVFGSLQLFAQQYSTTELSIIKPSQVILENYTRVNLSNETIGDPMANIFDLHNPYTYLQMIIDAAGNRYHIILQTNFFGKILFLCYSNNLSAVFNKKDKPQFLFRHCLKEMNNHLSAVQVTNTAIKCVLDRLNYGSED